MYTYMYTHDTLRFDRTITHSPLIKSKQSIVSQTTCPDSRPGQVRTMDKIDDHSDAHRTKPSMNTAA